jgi:uncharacterized protein YecT (DUF1311 family)
MIISTTGGYYGGGGWTNTDQKPLLSSFRDHDVPERRYDGVGFRPVLMISTAVPPKPVEVVNEATTGSVAQNSDTQLNAIYQEIIAAKKVNPDTLKTVQLRWIAYRDAQAELDAWGAGKTAPDEAARKASLERTTEERIVELQHIAQDGTSGDLPSPASGSEKEELTRAYAGLVQAIGTNQLPGVLTAFMPAQQAWLNFSIAQAKLDEQSLANSAAPHSNPPSDLVEIRFDRIRHAKLDALAASLGLQGAVAAFGSAISPEQVAQFENQALTTSSNTGGPPTNLLPMNDIGGNAFRGRGTVYTINDLKGLVGKNLDNAWVYGGFLLFNQDGNTPICHPKTAWSIQYNAEAHIEFQHGFHVPPGIWQQIANAEQALVLYEQGNPAASTAFAQANPCSSVMFEANKQRPLKILQVSRGADGKLSVYLRSPGGFLVDDSYHIVTDGEQSPPTR